MKRCPNCETEVHDLVSACPECGGRWDDAGRFSPPKVQRVESKASEPRTVGEMTPDALRGLMLTYGFYGALMAGAIIVGVLAVFGVSSGN